MKNLIQQAIKILISKVTTSLSLIKSNFSIRAVLDQSSFFVEVLKKQVTYFYQNLQELSKQP